MSGLSEIYFLALGALAAAGVLGWLLSLWLDDVSFVDSLWSLFFLMAAIIYAQAADTLGPAGWLVIALVAIWALRLSIYITARNWGEPEDGRYQKIRENNQPGFRFKSLYIVFGLQALLAWIISIPLLIAVARGGDIGWLEGVAAALWLIGFVFEAGGDWQLAKFRRERTNDRAVLDSGLWRYTRHPNYFGDACIWWAYWLFAVGAGGWWTFYGPALMTFLLLKVSGVALLEKTIKDRRPEYADYVERTSAFFPLPPKAASGQTGSESNA